MPKITTDSPAHLIVQWKASHQVKEAFQKLSQDIAGSKNETWCARILSKCWPKFPTREQHAFAIAICQHLLNPKVGSIKLQDRVIKRKMANIIVSINNIIYKFAITCNIKI